VYADLSTVCLQDPSIFDTLLISSFVVQPSQSWICFFVRVDPAEAEIYATQTSCRIEINRPWATVFTRIATSVDWALRDQRIIVGIHPRAEHSISLCLYHFHFDSEAASRTASGDEDQIFMAGRSSAGR
jgi:hypothetical protein